MIDYHRKRLDDVREWFKRLSEYKLVHGYKVRRGLHRKGRRSAGLAWGTLEQLFHEEMRRRGLPVPD
jgi:hypothetical protein